MIIGKAGAVIKGLRQEAGEMECNIDLQQNRREDGGDGSAKIVITGANGNDVMVHTPHTHTHTHTHAYTKVHISSKHPPHTNVLTTVLCRVVFVR